MVLKRGGWGSHCSQVVVLARHLKPGSESLERMMSLHEPKIRLHSTICRSRGSCEVILKNLLVSKRAVLSLMTTNESEWKTTRAKRWPMKCPLSPGCLRSLCLTVTGSLSNSSIKSAQRGQLAALRGGSASSSYVCVCAIVIILACSAAVLPLKVDLISVSISLPEASNC